MTDRYAEFDNDLKGCRACSSHLDVHYVDPCSSEERLEARPLVCGIGAKPVMVIGQTPGLSEYRTGKPYQGQAGKGIRSVLQELGVANFDSLVLSSAVAMCYAGRKYRKKGDKTSRCEDRAPSPVMVKNCRPFLERQIALGNPKVIVTLGSVPLAAYLEMSRGSKAKAHLREYVGRTEQWASREVVFFPHTSGGARWLNDSGNKALFNVAKALLSTALHKHGLVGA